MNETSFALFLFLLVFIVVIVSLIFSRRFKRRKELSQALDFILYEIIFPSAIQKEEEKKFKEFISTMEQFYSGMTGAKPYFVLEIGLPTKGREVVFYAAVAKKQSQLFEKQIQGLFPLASLKVKKEDYNIFKPSGFSLASYARLKKEDVFPIKTYEKFESDPLSVVINTFSKLQEEGEGAALQMVVLLGEERVNKKAKNVASGLRKGKSLTNALEAGDSLGKEFLKEFGNVIFGSSGKKEKEQPIQKPVDEELIKLFESKAAKPAKRVNIRLVVSSFSKEKAESILGELESAFFQFEEAQGNSLRFVRPKGRKLKELFYRFSFRLPEKSSLVNLNTAELSTIFHFPSALTLVQSPQLKYLKTKEVSSPLNLAKSGLLLGRNIFRGEARDVFIKEDDRRRHFYVIGQTGTGKSVLLKNMIVQDIEAGRGVCFIDPHGSDLEDILTRIPASRIEDVVYFNPADTQRPMALNMLEYDPNYPEQKTFIINELLGIFNKLFDLKQAGGPIFEQYFRNSAMLVMEDPSSGSTLLEIERVLVEKSFRDYKLERCTNPIVKTFWKEVAEKAGGEAALQNIVPYITSKFDTFVSNEIMRPIVSQEKSSFNFREVMDSQKILLVNLSKGRLGDINSHLLGLIIVGKLLMASLSRVDVSEEKRRDFYLYIDEFQNVTTDSIAVILSEARKYKLNLIISHQFIGQLEENIKKAVFGNVGSLASFRVGVEDAEFLAKQFEPVFNAYDLINIDNYNAYLKLLIEGQTSRPFNIQTPGFEKGEPAKVQQIATLSSLKYGRPRAEIEEEIRKKYG